MLPIVRGAFRFSTRAKGTQRLVHVPIKSARGEAEPIATSRRLRASLNSEETTDALVGGMRRVGEGAHVRTRRHAPALAGHGSRLRKEHGGETDKKKCRVEVHARRVAAS